MGFISFEFVVFFIVVLGLLAATNLIKKNGQKVRHLIVLLASYVFYAWWDYRFCFLMLAMTVLSYFTAKLINGKYRKLVSVIGISIPILFLVIFKYFNFFLDSFASVFNLKDLASLNIILPLGISFYTFQTISYIVDVYRGKQEAECFFNVALYISFFPVVTSGPIIKSYEFMPELNSEKKITLNNLEEGLQIIVLGLLKK